MITTGGYDRASGIKVAEETGQLIGYGSLFISNVSVTALCCMELDSDVAMLQPDLPFRLREDIPLTAPDQSTFYGPPTAEGYNTYPFSEEFVKSHTA